MGRGRVAINFDKASPARRLHKRRMHKARAKGQTPRRPGPKLSPEVLLICCLVLVAIFLAWMGAWLDYLFST